MKLCAIVSIWGPSTRLTNENMKAMSNKLKICAGKISKELIFIDSEIKKEKLAMKD